MNLLEKFSTNLFWDVRLEDVDMTKHMPYIVQRVLEYGMLEDWNLLKQTYSMQQIVEAAKSLRTLEPRALSYIAAISNTPKEDFRCYTTKQLNPELWNS